LSDTSLTSISNRDEKVIESMIGSAKNFSDNVINSYVDKSSEIIPDYDLRISDLPNLNIVQQSSSEMKASISNLQNLNTEVEKT
jgi:hypothetical protein